MAVEEKAQMLSEAILESEEYQKYLAAEKLLKENQELFDRVNEYRKKNFLIQNGESVNKVEEIRKLTGEYHEMLNYKEVKDYLESELLLCRMMQKINRILMEKLEFDVSFIG